MMEGEQWAFPHGNYALQHGMTLLDWYAGMAMQGLLAFPGAIDGNMNKQLHEVAKTAYNMAVIMVAERERRRNASKTT